MCRIVLLTLGLLAAPATARAVKLEPGKTRTPTEAALGPGKLLASKSETLSSGTYTATLLSAVIKRADGGLDFLFQVANVRKDKSSVDAISRFATTNFGAYTTDVFFAKQNKDLTGYGLFATGAKGQAASSADRNKAGTTVGFDFLTNKLKPTLKVGDTSRVLVIRTNAKTYHVGSKNATVYGGYDLQFSTFTANPEPASLVLLGGCAGLLGLPTGLRRLRASRAGDPAA